MQFRVHFIVRSWLLPFFTGGKDDSDGNGQDIYADMPPLTGSEDEGELRCSEFSFPYRVNLLYIYYRGRWSRSHRRGSCTRASCSPTSYCTRAGSCCSPTSHCTRAGCCCSPTSHCTRAGFPPSFCSRTGSCSRGPSSHRSWFVLVWGNSSIEFKFVLIKLYIIFADTSIYDWQLNIQYEEEVPLMNRDWIVKDDPTDPDQMYSDTEKDAARHFNRLDIRNLGYVNVQIH